MPIAVALAPSSSKCKDRKGLFALLLFSDGSGASSLSMPNEPGGFDSLIRKLESCPGRYFVIRGTTIPAAECLSVAEKIKTLAADLPLGKSYQFKGL